MLVTNLRRARLLKVLPQRGTVAEIGVFNGGFSKQIMDINQPRKLHLIDPWGGPDDEYLKTYNVGGSMDARYEEVKAYHAKSIEAGIVEIHRLHSYTAMPKFPDHHFDWLYVDGMHTYEPVLEDLTLVAPKVKPNGFIVGHDFSNSVTSRRRKFGVVRAVREFVARGEWTLVAFSNERAASYVLARTDRPDVIETFRSTVLSHDLQAFEVDDMMLDHFEQVMRKLPDGTETPIYRFAADVKRDW